MAAISPEKLKELMLKVRKGATTSLSLPQLQAIIEAIGGKWTPYMGFAPGLRRGDRNFVWADSPAEAQEKMGALKKLLVSSLPSKPKSGVMYVTKLDEPKIVHGDTFEIAFDSVTGVEGVRIEMPDGKKTEILPSEHSIQEARDYLDDGPRKAPLRPYLVTDWLAKNTDWVARVNTFMGVEEHVPAAERTRDRTGSCAVCFQNVKLAPEKNSIVIHGYKRPGTGTVHGKCEGVGYPPYELSSKGTAMYLTEFIEPAAKVLQSRYDALKANDISEFYSEGRKKRYTKDDPHWDVYLEEAQEDVGRRLKYALDDKEAYTKLVHHWKERALPKEGEKHIDWFVQGQKSASSRKVAMTHLLASRVASRFIAAADEQALQREFRRHVDDERSRLERDLRGKPKSQQDDARNDLEKRLRSEAMSQFGFTTGKAMTY